MANYPIKMLKDENGTPFVPLVAPGAINDGQGFDLLTELDKKLEKTNIIAGDNVTITTSGNDITINSAAGGASANVIDNLNQETSGVGVLDAHQGHVLKGMIPEVANNLTTVDSTKALSAYQGYLLDNRLNVDEETLDDLDEAINSVEESKKTAQGGNKLDIENVAESSAITYEIEGKCEQQTYVGKNLLNYNIKYAKGTTQTLGGVTVKFNADNSITLNGTMTSNNIELSGDANELKLYIDNTKSYYNLVEVVSGSFTKTGTVTPVVAYDCKFNAGSDTYYRNYSLPSSTTSTQINVNNTEYLTRFRIWQDSSLGNTTFNNFTIKFAIYEGNNTTEFEPYVGGISSPNPEYPQIVKTIPGIINLFDKTNINWVRNNNDNYTSTSNTDTTRIRTQNLIKLDGGVTYTISGIPTDITLGRVKFYANESSTSTSSYVETSTFTVPINATYVIFQFNGSNFTDETNTLMTNANIMLEEGSVSHEYIPYGYYVKVKVTGKNLLKYPYLDTTKTVNGITFTDNGDGTININGTATANASFKILGSENEQYTINGDYLYGGLSPDVRVQIVHYNPGYTVLARATGSSSQIDKSTYTTGYIEIVVQNGQTVSNRVIKPMMTSIEDTIYEPYKENITFIDMSKKNLFLNDESKYYHRGDTSITKLDNGIRAKQSDSNNYRYVGYILDAAPMLGKTFTIKCNSQASGTNVPNINIYWFDKTTNSLTTGIQWLSDKGGTFSVGDTLVSDSIIILFYSNVQGTAIANDYADFTDIVLYESCSNTPYHELCSIGEYKDVLNIDSAGKCYIDKKFYKLDINKGTLTSSSYVSGNSDATYSQFNLIFHVNKKPSSYNNGSMFKSDYFDYCEDAGTNHKTKFGIRIWDNYPDMVVSFPTKMVISGSESLSFQNWATDNNVSIYALLQTPEIINLPNAKIPLFEGINHIYLVDDLDTQTEIKYYMQNAFDDIYYNKQQVNDRIQDLIPEGGQSGQVLIQNDQGELTWGDAADPNAIVGDGSIKKIVELTYADYQALETVDPYTEYHILDAASSLDNLQATLDSLREQIDDLKTPNYITGSPAEAIVLNGTAWQVYDIPLTMINLQGTGLSIEDGKIKIGSNITNIRYNAHFNWHRDSGTANSQAVYFRLNLIRNGTKNVINQQIDILQPGFYGGAQFSSNWVVQEGDLISLGYMVATSDSYSSITAGYFETFLTVEKIS